MGVVGDGDDPVKAWVRSSVPSVVRELFAGGAAGAVAKTCVAPLERTKILLMTGRCKSGALPTLHLIFATEGVRGLFRGNGASCIRIMPYAAIHFSVYEAYRRLLTEHLLETDLALRIGDGAAAKPTQHSSGGGAAAAAAPVPPPSSPHLGEDVPPAAMTSSIDVSATSIITTVEEEQREEVQPAAVAASPPPPGRHRPGEGVAQRQQRPGPLVDLVAGSAAGATAVLMTYPLDMVRTRLAWAIDGAPGRAAVAATVAASSTGAPAALAAAPPVHHTRIGAMIAHTVRKEGVVGLYRGLAPTLYGIMPYAGLKFFVYGSLKQWYRETLQPRSAAAAAGSGGKGSSGGHGGGGGGGGERLPVPYMLAFGGVSGLLAQTVTYPLDVIRRRMQVYGIQQEAAAAAAAASAGTADGAAAAAALPQGVRLTTWDVGSKIVQQEGVRGLFRGLSLNYVKVVPSTAIGFTVYDMLKSYLGVTGNM